MTNLINSVKDPHTMVDVAIHLSQYGRDYYLRCKDFVKDVELITIFSCLAAEEEKHIGLYRSIRECYTEDEDVPPQVELVGEYGRFVEMISQGVKKDLQLLQMLSVDDAVRRAIQFETGVYQRKEKIC